MTEVFIEIMQSKNLNGKNLYLTISLTESSFLKRETEASLEMRFAMTQLLPVSHASVFHMHSE